jgi:hypothetical protein
VAQGTASSSEAAPPSIPVAPSLLPTSAVPQPAFANAVPPPWPPHNTSPFTFRIPNPSPVPSGFSSQVPGAAIPRMVPSVAHPPSSPAALWTTPSSSHAASGTNLQSLRPYFSIVPGRNFSRVDVRAADADRRDAARRHQTATRRVPRRATGSHIGLGTSTRVARATNDPSTITIVAILHAANVTGHSSE